VIPDRRAVGVIARRPDFLRFEFECLGDDRLNFGPSLSCGTADRGEVVAVPLGEARHCDAPLLERGLHIGRMPIGIEEGGVPIHEVGYGVPYRF